MRFDGTSPLTTRQWHYRLLRLPKGPLVCLLRAPLLVASVLYGALIHLRNRRYDRNPTLEQNVAAPVISIGNITTGGTGKTPLVADVVARLLGMGRSPAIVTRGYGSDRAGEADEARLLARSVEGVPCVINADRVAGAAEAIRVHRANVIVLDDAFQHRRIARDMNIVTIDATCPFGLGYLLPRGYLREPRVGLRRADLVVLTRTDQVGAGRVYNLWREVERLAPRARIVSTTHCPQPLRPLVAMPETDEAPVAGRAYLVSAIGNPDAFEQSVRDRGIEVCGHSRFDDHHHYTARDVIVACTAAAEAAADIVLVTEKDAVKLEQLDVRWYTPAWVLAVRIDFVRDCGKILEAALQEALDRCEGRHG